MKEFKPMKELINALFAIAKAIKSKNNSGEGGGEQSDYKIKLFSYNSEPVGLVVLKNRVGYVGKYSIEEIFASTPQQIAEMCNINFDTDVVKDIFSCFLYTNYNDVKQGVITSLNIHIIPGSDSDPDYQEIAIGSAWDTNPTIREAELNGKTYYFYDPFNGNPPIVSREDAPIIQPI